MTPLATKLLILFSIIAIDAFVLWRKHLESQTMNKAQLIEAIQIQLEAEQQGQVDKHFITKVYDAIPKVVARHLAIGEDVTLPDIGKLQTVDRAARTGRNPMTGESVQVQAKAGIKFKPAKGLKDALAYYQTDAPK